MRRVLRATLILVLVLSPATACAAELGPGPAGPATALTVPAEPRASSGTEDSGDGGDGGDDVAACFDGDCEVRVPGGTTIRVDPRFRVEGVLVTVTDGRGRIRIDTGTGYISSGGIGSTSIYDELSVRLLAVEGDTATVRLSAS